MKSVLFIVAIATSVFSLEFKTSTVVLPPVDGSVWNGSAWVVAE